MTIKPIYQTVPSGSVQVYALGSGLSLTQYNTLDLSNCYSAKLLVQVAKTSHDETPLVYGKSESPLNLRIARLGGHVGEYQFQFFPSDVTVGSGLGLTASASSGGTSLAVNLASPSSVVSERPVAVYNPSGAYANLEFVSTSAYYGNTIRTSPLTYAHPSGDTVIQNTAFQDIDLKGGAVYSLLWTIDNTYNSSFVLNSQWLVRSMAILYAGDYAE